MPSTVFHSATYGDFHVSAALGGSGPYVEVIDRRTGKKGDVSIGVGSIRDIAAKGTDPRSRDGWHLVKYSDERRLFLGDISPADIKAITSDFGLVEDRGASFRRSRAWLGLVDWVSSHPKIAAHYANRQSYFNGWHALAKEEAVVRGIAPFVPPARFDRKRRARRLETAVSVITLDTVSYSIPSAAHADAVVEALRDIIAVEMMVEAPTGRLRELAAALMLRDSWSEVIASSGEPVPGALDDGQLTDAGFLVRAGIQIAAFENFGIESGWAAQILARVRPTGASQRDSLDYTGADHPSVERSGVILLPEDRDMSDRILSCVRLFENAARSILRLVPTQEFGSFPGCKPGYVDSLILSGAAHEGGGFGKLAFQPLPSAVDEALQLEAEAIAATGEAWAEISRAGALPWLTPVTRMSLTMKRWGSFGESGGSISRHGPVEPGAWLEMRHGTILSRYVPDVEWPASRVVPLMLGLRRAFLDAGWSGGDVWMVRYQEGTGSVESHPVLARSAAQAVAWACASRFAFRELAPSRRPVGIRIHAVEGPSGPEDVLRSVALARENPVLSAPWAGTDRVRAAARPSVKMPEWQVVSGSGKRAVAIRYPESSYRSEIVVFHDDLGGLCERLDVPVCGASGEISFMGQTPVPMADIIPVALTVIDGQDPWDENSGVWGSLLRPDLARSNAGWNRLTRSLKDFPEGDTLGLSGHRPG